MTKKERKTHTNLEAQKVYDWCSKNLYNQETHQGGQIRVWKGEKRICLFLVSMTFHDLTLKVKGDIYKLPEFLDKWLIDKHIELKKENEPTLF